MQLPREARDLKSLVNMFVSCLFDSLQRLQVERVKLIGHVVIAESLDVIAVLVEV